MCFKFSTEKTFIEKCWLRREKKMFKKRNQYAAQFSEIKWKILWTITTSWISKWGLSTVFVIINARAYKRANKTKWKLNNKTATAMATEQHKRVARDGCFNGYGLKVWKTSCTCIYNWKWISKMDCGVSYFIWMKYTIFEFISTVLFNWNVSHSNECCFEVSIISFFLNPGLPPPYTLQTK